MVTKGRNLSHYFSVHCAGSNTYFVNSQGQSVYVRPWTIYQSRRRSVGFDRNDYRYAALPTTRTSATPGADELQEAGL